MTPAAEPSRTTERVGPAVPRLATLDDVAVLAAVLADAFTDDALFTWVFPDRADRPRLEQALFAFMAEHLYVPHGMSTVTDGAAALWRHSASAEGPEFWGEHAGEFVAAVEGRHERLGALAAAMDAHHPLTDHAYLMAIGVRPSAQGRGLGGALLDYTLADLDSQAIPAYLEATSPRSRALYERHGFVVTGEFHAEFDAELSPPLWAMWRAPNA